MGMAVLERRDTSRTQMRHKAAAVPFTVCLRSAYGRVAGITGGGVGMGTVP